MLLTKVAKEEEVCQQPPDLSLLEYQVSIEVHIEGGDDLQPATATSVNSCI